MNTSALYSTSQIVRDAVCDTGKQIVGAVEQPLQLVEYITLPDFGQRIILRFKSADNRLLTHKEADLLESRMRTLVGHDYWVTLTTDSSEHVDYNVCHQLIAINQAIPTSILHFNPTPHAEKIQQDAHIIRHLLDLTDEFQIWEIEVPISDTLSPHIIRIINASEEGNGLSSRYISERVTVGDVQCQTVYMKNNTSYNGCLKAYFAAQQQSMALANFIMQF